MYTFHQLRKQDQLLVVLAARNRLQVSAAKQFAFYTVIFYYRQTSRVNSRTLIDNIPTNVLNAGN